MFVYHCFHSCHRSLLFVGWLLRRCLHLLSSRLCLCLCFSTPIKALSTLVLWHLSSRLPLVRRLVVASSVIVRFHLTSPFVEQPRHVSILDPPSSFAPAGCIVSRLRCRRHLRPSSSPLGPVAQPPSPSSPTPVAPSPSSMLSSSLSKPHEVLRMNQEGLVISQDGWIGFVVG